MSSISIPGAVGGPVQRLSKDETTLLQKINEGLSEASWNRYHALFAKLEAETCMGITPTGRATVAKLQLNRDGEINLRRILAEAGVHPGGDFRDDYRRVQP